MSGAEATAVLRVISSIIAIVDKAKQAYDAAKDVGGLPDAFRVVAGRLPIILDILGSAQHLIEKGKINEESCRAVKDVVEECKRKAKKLDEIFQNACPEDGASRLEQYHEAVKTIGKENKLENLMQGILEDVQFLTCEHGMNMADEIQREQISDAITEVAALSSFSPEHTIQQTRLTTYQSGSGTQNNAQGEYVAQGEAKQYNSNGGTMNFVETKYHYHSSSHSKLDDFAEKNRRECLAALFLTEPKDDRERLLQTKGSRVDGTCIWIKDNASYKSWLCSDSQLLWLSGGPGKGKTMLSLFLSEELEHLAKQSHGTNFLEYYCDNKDDRRNSASAILRGLIYQILKSRAVLFKHIMPDFETQGEELFAKSSSFSLWRIFRDMLQDPDLGTVYCVLDGLDECDRDSLEFLLRKLRSLFLTDLGPHKVCRLKMIIVSRDLSDFLPEVLSSFPRATLDLDIDAEINHDIHRFIETKVSELSKLRRYSSQLCAHVKDVFRDRAQGTFLWIGIAAQELRRYTVTEVEGALKLFPRGLEPLFARMLLQIDPGRRQVVAQILRWVVLAARPLTVSELSIAIVSNGEFHAVAFSREEVMRDQISSCGYLLRITKDPVDLVHQSIKDYLLRKNSDSNAELEAFRIKEDEGNLELARRCFYYLQDVALLKVQLVKTSQDFRMSYKRKRELPREFPLLSYAMQYWPTHASALRHTDEIFDLSLPFYKDPKFCSFWRKIYLTLDGTKGQYIPYNLLHIASFFNLKPLAESIISTYRLVESKESSDPLNEPDKNGSTALHLAAKRGYVAVSQLLLDEEAQIDVRDNSGKTALHVAVEDGHLNLVRFLLDRGASTEARNQNGQATLHLAAEYGNTETVQMLLDRGAFIKATDESEETALHIASRYGHVQTVRHLLVEGASIEARSHDEQTALHFAVNYGDVQVVQLLLDKGAFIEAENKHGMRPLHMAAGRGLLTTVRLLLSNRADITVKDENDNTPLHFAAQSGNEELVQLMLEWGAYKEAKNRLKRTPLHFAAKKGHSTVVQTLLFNKVNVNSRDRNEWTALHHAAQCNAKAIVELLLHNGADPEMKCKEGETALHKAATCGCLKIVQMLLDKGALIDAQDKAKCTAVHHAAEEGRTLTLRHLLDSGASTEIRNGDGLTALQVAQQGNGYNDKRAVRLLQKY